AARPRYRRDVGAVLRVGCTAARDPGAPHRGVRSGVETAAGTDSRRLVGRTLVEDYGFLVLSCGITMPACKAQHRVERGQSEQRGLRARQTTAPRSTSARAN